MTSRKFQRTKEDFTCEHCKTFIHGSGYTNHCPHCLWCKHVDINPGDRQEECHGLMKPLSIEPRGKDRMITHMCTKCDFTRKNKVSENDNFDIVIALSKIRQNET